MVSIENLLKVSRPGWWLVNMWLYLAPTGQRYDLLTTIPFWLGFIYILIPCNWITYGLNDYVDVEIDKDNDRKGNWLYGAKCTRKELKEVLQIAVVVNAIFTGIFVSWAAEPTLAIVIFSISYLANILYNVEPIRLSGRPPFEFPNVIMGFYSVTLISCVVNHVPFPPLKYWVHCCFLVSRTQLWTEVMDVIEDKESGRRTTAVVLGKKMTLWVIALVLSLEAVVTFYFFEDMVLRGFSVIGIILFILLEVMKEEKDKKKQTASERAKDNSKKAMVMISQNGVGFLLMTHIWYHGCFL